MNLTEFEALETTVSRAKCPEDVFGDTPPEFDHVSRTIAELRAFQQKQDANLSARARNILEMMEVFGPWAHELEMAETYGSRPTWRAEINVTVESFESRQRFRVEAGHVTAFFDKLSAFDFFGYWRQDTVDLIRGDTVVAQGSVQYMGGPADHEFFTGSLIGSDRSPTELLPGDFELGDVLRIRTLRYRSAVMLLRFLC